MKRIFVALTVIALLAVPVASQELPPAGETNMSHEYEFVGTIDGCRVWKINFWGSNVFVTRCPGEGEAISNTQWSHICGKGCKRDMIVTATNEE